MTGQEAIPVDESQPSSGPCAWCGTTAHAKVVIRQRPRRLDKRTGVYLQGKPLADWACAKCLRRLESGNPGLERA